MPAVSGSAIDQATFAALMAGLGLREAPRHLAVAVSGGADSMALALLALDYARARGVSLTALTVDHGIRTESAEEARQVKAWLEAHDMACDILAPAEVITSPNLQEKAREARYARMTGWCRAHGAEHLLLAHHADDQLETVLMRLVRAAGVEGLAGMRPVSERQGILLLRPLLAVSKAQLVATLQARGQAWIEDPSNRSSAYTRNRLRPVAAALVAEGLDAERTALLTRQLAATADYLAANVTGWLYVNTQKHADGIISVPVSAWREVPAEIGWRALRQVIQEVGGGSRPVRSEKLMPLYAVLAAGALKKPRTLGGCLVSPRPQGRIEFSREKKPGDA